MLSPDESEKALRKFFHKRGVGQLADLFKVLRTGSRMSVFRRLNALGYRSSFTHAGRYYTLAEVPEFDSWGLWFHRQVGFSRTGTLKKTVVELVDGSPIGVTPKELRALLKLPVSNALYNTLSELAHSAQVQPQKLAGRTVYLSAEPQLAEEQIERRELQQRPAATPPMAAATETVIAVLVEALQAGEVLVDPPVISARLYARSIMVSAAQVEQIFSHYGLQPRKKTAAPASRPSRR
jgi:hypothetical protein